MIALNMATMEIMEFDCDVDGAIWLKYDESLSSLMS